MDMVYPHNTCTVTTVQSLLRTKESGFSPSQIVLGCKKVHPCSARNPPYPGEIAQGPKGTPGGTKVVDVGIIPHAPVLDEILRTQCHGRPPGVKLKNTARVRFEEPILDSKLRGEIDIINEFSSQ